MRTKPSRGPLFKLRISALGARREGRATSLIGQFRISYPTFGGAFGAAAWAAIQPSARAGLYRRSPTQCSLLRNVVAVHASVPISPSRVGAHSISRMCEDRSRNRAAGP